MEIILLSPNCLKIKGKNSSIIVDPQTLRQKVAVDMVLLLKENGFESSKIEEFRVIVKGPGEYEISGIKISAQIFDGQLVCELTIDGLNLVLGRIESVAEARDKIKESDIAILRVDSKIDQSVLTQLSPKIAVFYGEACEKAMAQFQKQLVSKFSVKLGSLPEEMETVLLG